jgi:hypothetical protein
VDEKNGRQECMCLLKLDRDGAASHDEEEGSARHGRYHHEEETEVEGSVDDMCWSICRLCSVR